MSMLVGGTAGDYAGEMDPRPYYWVSTAGHPNFGDEFITASWLRYLAQASPDNEVWLDCPEPGLASVLFEGLHPRLRVTNTLWRAVREAADHGEDVAGHVVRLVREQGSPRYDLGLLKLREVQSLHLLGGGFINGIWPQHAALLDGMRAVHGLTGARLYATGQGLMPLPGPPAEARKLFRDFAHASVRDAESAAASSARLGLDDAFLGAEAVSARGNGPPGIYVCIQSDLADRATFEAAVAQARALIGYAGRFGRAYYLEAIPGVDHPAYRQLADLIPQDRFIPFAGVWTGGLPVGPDQLWITTRFHFHLLAAAAGARGVALVSRRGYYDVKHASLAALGSGWTLLAPDATPGRRSIPWKRGSLHRRLPALAARKHAEASALYGDGPLPGQ
ncbi:polysaccharide pyruvyl transferase family protein [Arthrobacter sp. zg-Y40]|uniref:polysaccharide pyruvyl transferase family protein n=1 Tax=unclassified Arthrobacter TaxID=235627 RepID=UPI001D137341|nr:MULTISPECIES: polysaccharide pyruvyl transferase family protein [unclassified Arthrobacter]MCC3279347.1 polysaccharide pyruvyl transferase family protein [Arthrobacter sp. zg-Y40]MDK1327700.1 polysaccharide pyruvyl transferase family protein [Arthrobacter sp. zg-Y1143]